jgi:murein L,D-transpeptidase YcbB/YkuD
MLRFISHLHSGQLQPYSLQPATLSNSSFDPATTLRTALRSKQNFTSEILAVQPSSRSYVRLLWAWQRLLRTDSLAAQRAANQVAVNLERLRWEPTTDSLYLVANIPSQTLQVVRGAQVVTTHRIVVGRPETPTPELASRIFYFQTAPEWRVPTSIATREMLPRLRRNASYLAENNLRLYDAAGKVVDARKVNWQQVTPATFSYQIRQAAGGESALGNVVFRFANEHDVYLHDTNARKLFNQPQRLLSHGCIRLQRPTDLATFLLKRDGGADVQKRIDGMWDSIESSDTKVFSLRYSVGMIVRYQTVEADGTQLRFLPDVYGRDQAMIEALMHRAADLLTINSQPGNTRE